MDKRYNYHFTPSKGWMNDPNGMVYIDGVYHLFYQHYPDDIVWGPMHWGHATSIDLIHWEHQPIAIYPTNEEYIFSGSCVYDAENVSGLGTKENPPLLAFYTGHNPVTGEEQQCIAYSTDFVNFTKYTGNPVITNKKYLDSVAEQENPEYKKDFRDPKVFANPVLGGFSMVLAAGHRLEFYHSMDLLFWEKTGYFEQQGGFTDVCECPDCFPLETEEGTKWILTLSLTSHVMPYYVGEFNGKAFVEDKSITGQGDGDGKNTKLLIDYAMDNYAMVSFAGSPEPLLLGWGESWDYASQAPAKKYRGKMTMARYVRLVKTERGLRLLFAPVGEVADKDLIKVTLQPGESIELETSGSGKLQISVTESEITVDRTLGGNMSFSTWLMKHGLIHTAKRMNRGECNITILQDNGYFEIFAEDGFIVFSVMTY